MAYFYFGMQKTASGLLRRFGRRVTLRRVLPGAYDPAGGRRAGDTVLEWNPMALRLAINGKYLNLPAGAGQGGTRIRAGDMRILIDCAGWAQQPQAGDLMLFGDAGADPGAGGERWVIIGDQPVSPAGETVLYRGVIRKA